MTVLVTGGAGYIGSHVVKLMRFFGREVVVLDNLYNGFREAVKDCEFIEGDIANEELISKICQKYKIDSAIHFAALKSVGESMEVPHRYYEQNVMGTVKLTKLLMAEGVDKIVFSSSASVYGSVKENPINELSPRNPESVYAATKAVVEEFLSFCYPLGLSSVCLRYFNAAGASQDCSIGEDWSTTHNLIPRMMRVMFTQSEKLKVFGSDYPTPDGTCIRDYIHVDDLARAHINALEHLEGGPKFLTVNVGTGQGISVREVIDMAEKVSGIRVPYEDAPRRSGDPAVLVADPSYAQKILGWKSKHGLGEIVSSSYEWYKRHPNGYRRC